MHKYLLGILIFLFCLADSTLFCQEQQDKTKETSCPQQAITIDDIKQAFQEALQEIDAKKKADEEKLAVELKDKITAFYEQWMQSERQARESELNTLMHRNWEDVGLLTLPVDFAMPNDYYLRDYDYILDKVDVVKTQSVTASYKAEIKITEKLYIERDHANNASSLDPFLYTATRKITLKLDYTGDQFNLTDTVFGKTTLDRVWPKEVREKVKLNRP